jgi:hypothetical protein
LEQEEKILPISHTAHGEAAVYKTFKLNRHEKLIGLDASSFSFVLPSFFLRSSHTQKVWLSEGRAKKQYA